tara:strand:- start:1068 stop:1292 length:225 start_codon:yes stop_codon:yes gene_type:complete
MSRNNPFTIASSNHHKRSTQNLFTNSFEDEEDDDRRWSIANHQDINVNLSETGNFINDIHETDGTCKEYEVTNS